MKRFFHDVSVRKETDGFSVLTDDRPMNFLKTSRKMILPTKALAETVADEWRALPDEFKAKDLPVTCFLSGVAAWDETDERNVRQKMMAVLPCDAALCVAPDPPRLDQAMADAFQPVVDAVNRAAGTDFVLTRSVSGAEPSERSRRAFEDHLAGQTRLGLACLSKLTAVFGSLLLAFAVEKRLLTAAKAFDVSITEELYQNGFWPADAEAQSARDAKRGEALFAEKILLSI